MSTIAKDINEVVVSENVEEALPTINWLLAFAVFVVGVAGVVVIRWYQQSFSFDYGLDYFEPEFATYWMSVLYTELILITLLGLVGSAWVWFTRPAEVTMTPRRELKVYMSMLTFMVGGCMILPAALGLFVEADAAWHQVTIRDTDFTPTHIILFYGIIPLALAGGVIGFLYAHTRLPDFRNRVSLNLAITLSGFLLIMPNLGFNEWGHTFFYAEELFAAPIHWGFVTLGWSAFAIGGFFVQILSRLAHLTRVIKDESVREEGNKVSAISS